MPQLQSPCALEPACCNQDLTQPEINKNLLILFLTYISNSQSGVLPFRGHLAVFADIIGCGLLLLSSKHQDGGGLVTKSCLTCVTPWTVARLLYPWDLPGKVYWSELPFSSPGNLFPTQGLNPSFLHSTLSLQKEKNINCTVDIFSSKFSMFMETYKHAQHLFIQKCCLL